MTQYREFAYQPMSVCCRKRSLASVIICHAANWHFPDYSSQEHSSPKSITSRKQRKAVRGRLEGKRLPTKDVRQAKDQVQKSLDLAEGSESQRKAQRYSQSLHADIF